MTGCAPATAECAKPVGADACSVDASVAVMAAKPMIALEAP
jgi:methanogenic corrinoid protein MtbC1